MHKITLNRKNLKRFVTVFNKHILYLNILDIDILTIASIKSKLNTAYLDMKKINSKTQTITFTIEELRVFKKLSKEFIEHNKTKKESNSNESNFDKYLNKFQGLNNDK